MSDDIEIAEKYTYPSDPIANPRKGVIEGREYSGPAATNLLRAVQKGDVLEIHTWGSSTPDPTVTVTGREFDEALAVSAGSERYRLWPRYPTQGKAMDSAWLRSEPGNDSRGEIQTVIVVERAESEDS